MRPCRLCFGVNVAVETLNQLARAFEALLFQIEPLDAASYAAGALLLLLAALAAALAPARRVLKVDPASALRSE